MQPELLEQGVSLLIYGMGTVFVFLTVLVFATKAMSALVRTFADDTAAPIAVTTARPADKPTLGINDDIKSAIQQALALYRQKH